MATVAQAFEPKGFDLFSGNQPTLVLENGTSIPISGYLFDAVGEKFYRRFSAYAYLSGNVTVRIRWYSETGQTTGNVRWDAAIAAVTPGDAQSILTKALASATNTTTTVNGTARGVTTTDVTVSNLDSLAADDEVWLAISMGAATMTGGAVIESVEVIYASTAGVGAGNVSNAGGSTDNAIARFDLGTGQVIQGSVVIVDDSGNVTGMGTLNAKTIANFADPASPAVGDVPFWNGSIWVPKCRQALTLASDQTVTTTRTDVTGCTHALRVGRHLIDVYGSWTTSGGTATLGIAFSFSGTATLHMDGVIYNTALVGTFNNVTGLNTDLLSTGTATTVIQLGIDLKAELVVTVAGTLALRCIKTGTTTLLLKAGSGMAIYES